MGKFKEDILPLLITALGGAATALSADPQYIIYGTLIGVLVKYLNGVISKN